jgi:hypothetical protein
MTILVVNEAIAVVFYETVSFCSAVGECVKVPLDYQAGVKPKPDPCPIVLGEFILHSILFQHVISKYTRRLLFNNCDKSSQSCQRHYVKNVGPNSNPEMSSADCASRTLG